MISIEKKFLFIHVPKTGGSSIQSILGEYSDDQIVTTTDHQDGSERFEIVNHKYRTTKHSSLSQYKKLIDEDIFNPLFKFATVRNPWDRAISYYFSPHRKISKWDREGFKSFIKKIKPLRHYISAEKPIHRFLRKVGIHDNDNDLLKEIDFLIRFENLQEDFDHVCKTLGLNTTVLPKKNASKKVHYSEYYDQELRELVARQFEEEIECGKYKFI